MPKFARVPAEHPEVVELQQELARVLAGITDSPLLDGRLLTLEVLSANFTNFAHGLGRIPKGWIQISPRQLNFVWEDSSYPADVDKAKLLRLQSDADATMKVWVF